MHPTDPTALTLDMTRTCVDCGLPLVAGWCARRLHPDNLSGAQILRWRDQHGTVPTIADQVWVHAACVHAAQSIARQLVADQAEIARLSDALERIISG